MDKANKITTILLKVVATCAIIVVSFFYCSNLGNDRFSTAPSKLLMLDKKTGTIYWVNQEENIKVSRQWDEFITFQD